jgi:superfamily II DNA or RNA helicase
MDEYRDLSEKIRLLYGRLGAKARDSQRMTILLNARRRILEAAEDKIRVLRSCLSIEDPREIRHTLIYATDKFPEQLEDVNALLRELGIRFHQLTEEETSDARKVERLVHRFRHGDIQVLTAKRVLDEGFNIPEISSAYILASTTVERQWTQRRGRILRLCPQTGKTKATLHDVIALPPANEPLDDESQRLVRGELMRVEEFARLSANVSSRRGAYAWVREAQLEYRVWID